MKNLLTIIIAACLVSTMSAQEEKKSLQIVRTDVAPKIDGVLDEAIWLQQQKQ